MDPLEGGVGVEGCEGHDERTIVVVLVRPGGEYGGLQQGVLQLDHGQPLLARNCVESAQQGGLVDGLVHDRAHEVRAPATQGAAEDAEGALADEPPAEIAQAPAAVHDRPLADLEAAAGRQVIEPHLPVEEVPAGVGGHQLVPAVRLLGGERLQVDAGHERVPTRNSR